MFREGDCLVLAVRGSALFGKPERKEWTLTRFLKDGAPGGSAGPVTLGEALDVARTLVRLGSALRPGADNTEGSSLE